MKQALEDVRDVLSRLPGAIDGAETVTISSGSVTPTQNVIEVDTEGGAASDFLDNIDASNMPEGSLLLIRPATPSHLVSLRHAQGGAGELLLKYSANYLLGTTNGWCLLINQGSAWAEIARNYGTDAQALERSNLGLGTVAVLDDGDVDANTLQGNAPSAFLGASAQAADAAQLDGHPASDFLQLDETALQTMVGRLRVDAGASEINNPTAGASSVLELRSEGVLEALLEYDDLNAEILLRKYDAGGGDVPSIILDLATGTLYIDRGDGVRYELWGDNAVLNGDVRLVTEINIGTKEVSGSSAPGEVVTISMDKGSFYPDWEGTLGQSFQIVPDVVGTPNANPAAPKFSFKNNNAGTYGDWSVGWEFIKA